MSIDEGMAVSQANAEKEKNRLYILTGNKGGVGKSTIAVLTADYMIRHGMGDRLIVGDCEMSDLQRTFYKNTAKSGLVEEDQTSVWSMGTDESFEAFMDDVAAMSGKSVIVDTGANMLNLLTEQAAFLSENLEEIGADATIIFVVGPGAESTAALKAYIKAVTKLETPFKTHIILLAGGADSIDKMRRLQLMAEGYPKIWWKQEGISEGDMARLADVSRADIVISHTCPASFPIQEYLDIPPGQFFHEPSQDMLEKILLKYHPRRWFFGHFHQHARGRVNGCKWEALDVLNRIGKALAMLQLEWED